MKRFLATILAVLYLSTSIGATIHMHYCMGEFVSWELMHKKNPTNNCEKCGMPISKKKGCCDDRHAIIKVKGEHKLSNNDVYFFKCFYGIYKPELQILKVQYISLADLPNQIANAPPPLTKISLFLYICLLRI